MKPERFHHQCGLMSTKRGGKAANLYSKRRAGVNAFKVPGGSSRQGAAEPKRAQAQPTIHRRAVTVRKTLHRRAQLLLRWRR